MGCIIPCERIDDAKTFNNIGPDGLRVLAEGLGARELDGEQDSTLSLNLSYNPLVGRPYSADPTGVTDLFQALGRHKSSKVLSLGHTGIGHPNVALPCVMQIAKWLKNDRVETLDLSHNEIESVELHKLAMWLNRALPDLKVLDLTGNECYEHEASVLFQALGDQVKVRASAFCGSKSDGEASAGEEARRR